MRKSTKPISGPAEAQKRHAACLRWIEQGRPEGRELDHGLAASELLRQYHGRCGPQRRVPATSAPAVMVPANN